MACAIVYFLAAVIIVCCIMVVACFYLDPVQRFGKLTEKNAPAYVGALIAIVSFGYFPIWTFLAIRPKTLKRQNMYARAFTTRPFELHLRRVTYPTKDSLEDEWTVESTKVEHAFVFCFFAWIVVVIVSCVYAFVKSQEAGLATSLTMSVLTVLIAFLMLLYLDGTHGSTEDEEKRVAMAKARYAAELMQEYDEFKKKWGEVGGAADAGSITETTPMRAFYGAAPQDGGGFVKNGGVESGIDGDGGSSSDADEEFGSVGRGQ